MSNLHAKSTKTKLRSQDNRISKKGLLLGSAIATIIAITPFLFNLYESVPQVRVWNTFLFTYESPYYENVYVLAWTLMNKLIPLLLIFSSLGLWLREAGVERATVTFFSWAALGYSFKFVWAPLVDCLPLPYLTRKLGRRRAWILVSQLAIMTSILLMAFTDPSSGLSQLKIMALAAVMLGFSSATQDIVIDAYRIESADIELQALMSSTYIAGYRIGMLVSGAGSLFLAGYLGSEMKTYDYSAW